MAHNDSMINITKEVGQLFPRRDPLTKDEFIIKSKVILRALFEAWQVCETRMSITEAVDVDKLSSPLMIGESNTPPPSDFDEHFFVRLAESIIFDSDLIKLINTRI